MKCEELLLMTPSRLPHNFIRYEEAKLVFRADYSGYLPGEVYRTEVLHRGEVTEDQAIIHYFSQKMKDGTILFNEEIRTIVWTRYYGNVEDGHVWFNKTPEEVLSILIIAEIMES